MHCIALDRQKYNYTNKNNDTQLDYIILQPYSGVDKIFKKDEWNEDVIVKPISTAFIMWSVQLPYYY